VPGGENATGEVPSPRQDRRDAGPDRALADDELALAPDQRDVADLDAGDVGDRVERPRGARKRDAEVARPGLRVGAYATKTTSGRRRCAKGRAMRMAATVRRCDGERNSPRGGAAGKANRRPARGADGGG